LPHFGGSFGRRLALTQSPLPSKCPELETIAQHARKARALSLSASEGPMKPHAYLITLLLALWPTLSFWP
jgi:hypothetical protein